ncbi:polysaccharide biosynthesis/export family protein [Roseobacter sp.]|uniref:polysaccharide biosynthesis/export family protein n=1 Tax=Roseobacter sp. TaxID=1907202 RepID=UPI00385AE63F
MRYIAGLMATALLFGCAGSGPRTESIFTDEQAVIAESEQDIPFAVVAISSRSAKASSDWLDRSQSASFIPDTGSAPVVIGPSDILEVSIVSTSESGFIDLTNSTLSPISTTTLPSQEVGSDGMISVPPLGRVSAQGQTAQDFEQLLESRLGEVLVDPSVIVRISERRSARVSILGAVVNPGTFSLNQNNMFLVEVLAEAGGPDGRSEDLEISLSRQGVTGRATLNRVYENPSLNIHMRAGDVISVEPPNRRLTVLGAGGVNNTITYDQPVISLAEALSRAGGLLNRRADKKGVFVYREISSAAAADLGIDVTVFGSGPVPAIFNIDLSKPQALFAAKEFKMGRNDLIYISDSVNEEISAVFGVLTNFTPTPAEYVRDATIGTSN